MPYIYKITNMVNQKIYIGKTLFTIEKRFKQHMNEYLKREKEHRPLYSAIKKYGIESFEICILEECSVSELSERERFWIESLGSFKNGYNATRGGDGTIYADYDLIFSLFEEGKNIKEIAAITKYCEDTVRTGLISYGITEKQRSERGHSSLKKPVAKLDPETLEIIEVFSSTGEAKKSVGAQVSSHIAKVCQGKRKTAYGYKWKYL